MKFQPKSEREIRDEMTLPAGEYDFEIANAEDTTSSKGNDMIALVLRVFPSDGGAPRLVRDWLVPKMELKLNRFCRCVGLTDVYESGALDAFACQQLCGRVKLGIEESDEYGKQNRVVDYIASVVVSDELPNSDPPPPPSLGVPSQQTKAALAAAHELPIDKSEIPF